MGLVKIISEIKKMILKDLIHRLPKLNCKSCGFPTCESLAQAIINGEAKMEECQPFLEKNVTLTVNGRDVFLNSFPREFVKYTVLGMVSNLKGINKTRISHIDLKIKV